ncbi:MAG: glycosyltransferase family 2 protein, partial [Clostridia bacterium]|nr:glycosyltransferase family 2 protein [Clostridia bacterium]
MISIVVPCYNEEEAIPLFIEEIKKIEAVIKERYEEDVEYIFVDDGSKDNTSQIMKKYSETIKYIILSRNFGKEGAMYAGLEAAKGDYVAVMDVDLQDPPELLLEMYECVKSGEYDCAAARRCTREGEPKIRSFFARQFYKLINKISEADIVDGARDYRLMSRKMVDAILSMREYNRFSKGIFGWVGFKTKWISYENVKRAAGETKWSFWKLLIYSLEGIVAFSTMPLSIAAYIGLILCVIAMIMICVIIVKTLVFGDPVAGYPSLICVIFLLSGVQLFCMGILSGYMSKLYLEA